jgi:hypothetical protein
MCCMLKRFSMGWIEGPMFISVACFTHKKGCEHGSWGLGREQMALGEGQRR